MLILLPIALVACRAPHEDTRPTDTAPTSETGPTDTGPSDTGPTDTATSTGALPLRGLLQFHVEHDLADASCLPDCFMSIEEEDDLPGFLDAIRSESTFPVLHWDRAVPWLAFSVPPDDPAQRVAFYDARLDPALLAWIDGFADHFAQQPGGYLAVSPLHGSRDSLAPQHLPGGVEQAVSGVCPDASPGQVFDADGGSFEIASTWTNFVLYLADKLHPSHVGLMVEADLFRTSCPGQWDSLVSLYRQVHDEVRAELGPEVPLFATLTLPGLLGYRDTACAPDLAWALCDEEPPEPPILDVADCYPLDRVPLTDLEAGGRMDLLALSFYPDGLGMAAPGTSPTLRALDPGTEDCLLHARLPERIDPLAQIDRLGWDGPVAFAETSARGGPTRAWLVDGDLEWLIELPGSPESQAYWMTAMQQDAARRPLAFLVGSFLHDYPPIGAWTVRRGLFDPWLFSVLNGWVDSGILDAEGRSKGEVTELWRAGLLPSP